MWLGHCFDHADCPDRVKIVVPDEILLKPALLTSAERRVIQRHGVIGHEILGKAESPILRLGGEIALTHHEWLDGTGYPHGSARGEIPELARIISVADTYDVMTARDSYRAAITHEQAVSELRRVAGTQLDPHYVDLFITTIEHRRIAFAHADDRDLELELRRPRSALT